MLASTKYPLLHRANPMSSKVYNYYSKFEDEKFISHAGIADIYHFYLGSIWETNIVGNDQITNFEVGIDKIVVTSRDDIKDRFFVWDDAPNNTDFSLFLPPSGIEDDFILVKVGSVTYGSAPALEVNIVNQSDIESQFEDSIVMPPTNFTVKAKATLATLPYDAAPSGSTKIFFGVALIVVGAALAWPLEAAGVVIGTISALVGANIAKEGFIDSFDWTDIKQKAAEALGFADIGRVDFEANLLTSGSDRLAGTQWDDVLDGFGGADILEGKAGDDTYIVDDAGDRVIEIAGEGTDSMETSVAYTLAAGQSVEILRLAAGTAALSLTGNGIANTLYDNAGNNRLDGGGGVDLIYSSGGVDTLIGGPGADSAVIDRSGAKVGLSFVMQSVGGTTTLVGDGTTTNGIGNITLTGGAGNDRFVTLDGTDVLSGGAGNDTISAGASNDVLNGGVGNDTLNGGTGVDQMTGGAGNDTYVVDTSADRVFETKGEGSDRVFLTSTYYLASGQEIEALQLLSSTGTAKFNVAGNEFGQTLVGNAGANALDGKGGADVLTGNRGADTFVFSTALGSANVDRITDFASEDTIRLSKSVFTAIAPGQLAESAFKNISTAKIDANDRILYKQTTGELFYDADGSGAGAAVKFAVLDNHAKVTHADFLIG